MAKKPPPMPHSALGWALFNPDGVPFIASIMPTRADLVAAIKQADLVIPDSWQTMFRKGWTIRRVRVSPI